MEAIGVNVNTVIANAATRCSTSQRLTAESQSRQMELQRSNADLALLAAQNRDIETKNAEIEQARQEIEARANGRGRTGTNFLAEHVTSCAPRHLLVLARLLAQDPLGNLTAKQVEYATADQLRLGPAAADQRHPRPDQGRGGEDGHQPGAVRARGPDRGPARGVRLLTEEKRLGFTITTGPGVPADRARPTRSGCARSSTTAARPTRSSSPSGAASSCESRPPPRGSPTPGRRSSSSSASRRHWHQPGQPHEHLPSAFQQADGRPAAPTAEPASAWRSAAGARLGGGGRAQRVRPGQHVQLHHPARRPAPPGLRGRGSVPRSPRRLKALCAATRSSLSTTTRATPSSSPTSLRCTASPSCR